MYRLNPSWWGAKLGATVLGWLLVALIVVLGLLALYGWRQHPADQDVVIRAISSDNVADATWKGATVALEVHRAEKEAKVEEALSSDPVWADAPIPESVADQLRDPDRKAKQ